MHTYIHTCMHTYIYIERETETEKGRERQRKESYFCKKYEHQHKFYT